jgi:serine/threonine-protein kinase
MIPDARRPHDDGALLGGRYRLNRRIAGGGMGEVWAALDEVLARSVAVKILRRELADDPTFRERFRAEARHAASLSHRGIAAIYDYDDGTADMRAAPFLVMELVPGEPLSTIISDQGRLSPARTLDVVGQAARALQAAHDGGVIHRDIKPGNLLVTPDGTVKITDFGISRATNSVPLTLTGAIMGTAYYISPEQASGGAVTPASDIYSLGIVAYECLTGRRPFDGDTPVGVALAQVREEAPALPRDIPVPVHDLVMRMLAKQPDDRPASAAEVSRQAFSVGASASEDATTRMMFEPAATAPMASPRGEEASRNRPTDTDPRLVLPPPEPDGRRRRIYVLLGGTALLLGALALAGVLAAGGNRATVPPSASSTPTPSVAADARVEVDPDTYVGRPAVQVAAELRALGLRVDLDDAEGNGPAGSVSSVSPAGAVAPETLITVTVIRAADGGDDERERDRDEEKKKDEEKEKDDRKGKD